MIVSQEEFDDLCAEVTAYKLMINSILIGLMDKKVFSGADIEVLVESTLSSLDKFQDQSLGDAAKYLEQFRVGTGLDE